MRTLTIILVGLVLGATPAPSKASAARQDGADQPAEAQPPDRPRRRRQPPSQEPRQRPDQPADAAAPSPSPATERKKTDDRFLAVKGATVHTVGGSVLPGATIVCTNGKITAVGAGVPIPEKAEVIDASGLLPEESFRDCIHMLHGSAPRLTQRIADSLRSFEARASGAGPK